VTSECYIVDISIQNILCDGEGEDWDWCVVSSIKKCNFWRE